MLPPWFIDAKQAGESPDRLRVRVEAYCRESNRGLNLPDTTPDPLWVDMVLMQLEAYFDEYQQRSA